MCSKAVLELIILSSLPPSENPTGMCHDNKLVFLRGEKKGVELEGWGSREDLEEMGEEK